MKQDIHTDHVDHILNNVKGIECNRVEHYYWTGVWESIDIETNPYTLMNSTCSA